MILGSLSSWIFALSLLPSIRTEDTVNSGNYLIHLCNSEQPNSQAAELQILLPQVWKGLQRVIADLQKETGSLHGYNTFFKNESSKTEVLEVYQEMADGAGIHIRGDTNRMRMRYPTFICANNVTVTELFYRYCVRRPNTALMSWRRTEFMPLCPYFWEVKSRPSLSDCPLVVANTLTPNDDRLLNSQEALIVGALVHLYHNNNEELITAITDVSELDATQSLLNAPNYAFYYAGREMVFLHSIESSELTIE